MTSMLESTKDHRRKEADRLEEDRKRYGFYHTVTPFRRIRVRCRRVGKKEPKPGPLSVLFGFLSESGRGSPGSQTRRPPGASAHTEHQPFPYSPLTLVQRLPARAP